MFNYDEAHGGETWNERILRQSPRKGGEGEVSSSQGIHNARMKLQNTLITKFYADNTPLHRPEAITFKLPTNNTTLVQQTIPYNPN